MLGYVFRRILFAIPIALGVSVVCFSLVYLAPGDPLQTVLPPDATAETIAIVKHAYGFDRPIPVQYVIWLWHVLQGDFGRSIATPAPGDAGGVRLRREHRDAGGCSRCRSRSSSGIRWGPSPAASPGRIMDRVVTRRSR